MGNYETQLGYIVRETLDGLEVTENGCYVCTLDNKSLDDYRMDNGIDINDDLLEADIKEMDGVETFIEDLKQYC